MKRLQLDLETSVWNFYFADDAPEKRESTIQFFQLIQQDMYDIFISQVVLDEIQNASPAKQSVLYQLIQRYQPEELMLNDDVLLLAERYIQEQALPARATEDAKHVAVATYYGMDAVISWNLKHLANLNRRRLIQGVNIKEGFSMPLELLTPMEVSYYE